MTIIEPADLNALPNNGAFFSPFPGAGQGTLRVPFVELYIKGQSLPLIDAGPHFDSNRNPTDLSPQKPVLLLKDFRYRMTGDLAYGNEVSITILDPQYDYLAGILANNDSQNAEFSFRFGWRGIDDQAGQRFPSMFITNFSLRFHTGFSGVEVEIRGVDAGWNIYTKQVAHAFDPKMYISDVIKEVISRTSPLLIPEVENIPIPVGEGFNRMENVTPFAYIDCLLDIAKSGSQAASSYLVDFEPGPFGKTRVIVKADVVESSIIRKYIFGREAMGTMIEFHPTVEGALYLASGAAKSVTYSVDPITKKTSVRTSTQQEDVSAEKRKINETPIDPGRVYMCPWSNPSQVEGFLQGLRQMMDNHTMFADAVVHGDAGLLPLRQVAVLAIRSDVPGRITTVSDKSILFVSGVYKLETVEHIISAGIFRTLLHMYRNSSPFGAEAAKSQKPVDITSGEIETGRIEKLIT